MSEAVSPSGSSLAGLRRLSTTAIVFLVVLRLAIGWQLLYEGLWKYNSLSTANPWSAEGYLKNARGPMRDLFRAMTGDPNDERYTSYNAVSEDWKAWLDRFIAHYQLDPSNEQQKEVIDNLRMLLEGPEQIAVPLSALPPGIAVEDKSKDVVIYNDKGGVSFRLPGAEVASEDGTEVELVPVLEWGEGNDRLTVNRQWMLLPSEQNALRDAAIARGEEIQAKREALREQGATATPAEREKLEQQYKELGVEKQMYSDFVEALIGLEQQIAKRGYLDRLRGALRGNADLITVRDPDQPEDSVYYERPGEITQYRNRLQAYEDKLANARLSFQHDHLDYDWQSTQELRSTIVNPIKALEDDFKNDAYGLISDSRMTAFGAMPEPWDNVRVIDTLTIGGLIVLGTLLLLGLLTKFAAFGAAMMLFSFYLAYPPLPGVVLPASPEHALIVNKNLIEVIALFALMALPTGSWFGLDALWQGWRRERKANPKPPKTPKTAKSKTSDAKSTS